MKLGNSELCDSRDIADTFDYHFSSVYSSAHPLDLVSSPDIIPSTSSIDFLLAPSDVKREVKSLNPKCTAGLDNIPDVLINDCYLFFY